MSTRFWQFVRRCLQLGSLLGLVWVAFGGWWRNYKIAHNNSRLVGLVEGEFMGEVYALNERFLELFGESFASSLNFLGMHWSSTVAGIESVDPTLLMAQVAATGSFSAELAGAAAVPVFLALIAGRIFCSHICPARLVFEIGELIRRGLKRRGVTLWDIQVDAQYGGWVLLGGLIASALGGSVIWLFVLPYVSLGAGLFLLVTTQAASLLLGVMGFWLLIDVLFAPGLFCGSVCPTGFLLQRLGWFRVFALRTKPEPAPCPTGCTACTRACPYGISSRDARKDPACDNCGRCVSACPAQRLQRRFGKPLSMMMVVGMLMCVPVAGFAHHNKGLPHYGYFDNYPQVPTDEYVVIDGRWEMGAVIFNFQGYDLRETSDTPDDIKIYLYLYDLERDTNYRGDVDFEVLDDDGNRVAEYLRLKVDEEAVYSTRERLPASGDYTIVAHIPTDPPQRVELPFYVDLRDGPNYALLAGIGFPVLLIFGLAWNGRSRRRKR